MVQILWLILVMGYGYVTWAAGSFSKAALSFLNGGYLAFLCFSVLPRAMGTERFYLSVLATGTGVLLGLWTEEKEKLPALFFCLVTACHLFWGDPLSAGKTIGLACMGGVGLYHASAGILPDRVEIGKALLSAAGFITGTILFSCF